MKCSPIAVMENDDSRNQEGDYLILQACSLEIYGIRWGSELLVVAFLHSIDK